MNKHIQTKSDNLGAYIRMERKSAGVTQAQLGKMIGLSESRVSKIENGAPITPAVASFILGKLGSKLEIRVRNTKEYNKDNVAYLMSVTYHYAKIKNIPLHKAYQYLETFKGIDFLLEFKEIEQTLAYEDIVEDLTRVCARNGGAIS